MRDNNLHKYPDQICEEKKLKVYIRDTREGHDLTRTLPLYAAKELSYIAVLFNLLSCTLPLESIPDLLIVSIAKKLQIPGPVLPVPLWPSAGRHGDPGDLKLLDVAQLVFTIPLTRA